MIDLAQGIVVAEAAVVPKPSSIGPRPLARPQAADVRPQAQGISPQVPGSRPQAAGMRPQAPPTPSQETSCSQPGTDSRRGAAHALDVVLTGVRLGSRDRQFLSRLVHWDKRNAASVASLLWRARLAGRDEAALTPRQLEIVLAALGDAATYRATGADATGCWDCENIPGGRCADHARDSERTRACADLAVLLSGRAAPPGLPQPTDISGYRHRTPVAS